LAIRLPRSPGKTTAARILAPLLLVAGVSGFDADAHAEIAGVASVVDADTI
jgi:endonuclease YncB( thermonuclease family)